MGDGWISLGGGTKYDKGDGRAKKAKHAKSDIKLISQVESDGLKSNQVKPDESDGIGNVNPFGGR